MNAFPKLEIPADLPDLLRPGLESRWSAYCEAAREAGVRVPAHPDFQRALARVWVASDFVAINCVRDPALLAELLASGDLLADYAPGEMHARLAAEAATTLNDAGLGQVLRRFRQREMVRIAWRDLAGWARVDEVLADLSDMADACVQVALDTLHEWQCQTLGRPKASDGRPQTLVVLGMGKLGARELNFSSDIDLIFAYPETGFVRKRHKTSLEEFFTQLGRRLIAVLNDNTAEGFVFRVDMRLRPFGDSGPLVMDFAMLEDYYQSQGREWERYAMIKARPIAGAPEWGAELTELLRPFIYRRYLDFGAFEQLREMKGLIMREVARRGLEQNVKLGPGGIREIEFIAQAFQLIRGGRESGLRERSLLKVLGQLAELDLMPAYAVKRLAEAYRFLRRVENRIQEFEDAQAHSLPADHIGQARLAYSMKFPDWESFLEELDDYRQFVHEQFQQVFGSPQTEAADGDAAMASLWSGEIGDAEAYALLGELGFDDAEEAWRLLTQSRRAILSRLGQRGRERLKRLMPLLLNAVGEAAEPSATLARTLRLIESIAGRSAYLALLVEHPMALSQLVRLCDASPWIADQLKQHPVLLDELLDPRSLYQPPGREELQRQLERRMAEVDPDDLEQQMEILRHFKQTAVLRVAAADVVGAARLMVISDYLTDIAEVVLNTVLELAWRHMIQRHGRPWCTEAGHRRQATFVIIGYGKLGGIELGYGSDLDLVFLHDSRGEDQNTDGKRELDNAVFFARLGQRVIHILNTLTPSGVLYEVDMRLRPSGASGLLVTGLDAFAQYQREEAWTWEHQALVRARPVSGDDRLAMDFERVRQEILCRRREPQALRDEVREMRERMRRELGGKHPGRFDLKQDSGGIADIEFMVQYCILRWAHDYPELVRYSDNIRLLDGLAEHGLLAGETAEVLADAYRAYRKRAHQLTLQEAPAAVDDQEFGKARGLVQDIWRDMMGSAQQD